MGPALSLVGVRCLTHRVILLATGYVPNLESEKLCKTDITKFIVSNLLMQFQNIEGAQACFQKHSQHGGKTWTRPIRVPVTGLRLPTHGYLIAAHSCSDYILWVGPESKEAAVEEKSVSPSCSVLQLAQQSGRETASTGAKPCDDPQEESPDDDSPNPLRIEEIDDTLRGSLGLCPSPAPLAQLAEQLTLNQ